MFKRSIVGSLLFSIFTMSAYAVEFNGQVSILEKGKTAAIKEYQDAVIYFVPEEPVDNLAPLSEVEMRMEKKSFLPRVMPVTLGSKINFPNFDPILHNAFSTTNRNKFDLGLYSGGEVESHVFDNIGLVRIYCNVHHSMVGYILVLNTPYFTKLSKDGKFNLSGLPEEVGTLYLWHPRAKVIKQKIDLSQGVYEDINYELDLTKRRIPKHKNKLGKSYRKKRERSY